MWIVPKTLSAFVPDTEGLRMGLAERAWMLEQSAMWRSKPSSKQTWLRRLKKGGWITALSTRILKPSQQKSFEEKYTASLVDIPVSRFQARGSEKEKKTQDTYGHTSESMSGQLDLFGASLKMSEVTPRWGYGESCPIWKKMVTERSGDCTQRRKQARLTNASDASSWQNYPTPTSRDWKGKQANEYKDERGEENNMKFASLPGVVDKISKSNWATPNTMDHLPSGISGSFKESLTGRRKRSSNLREQVNPKLNWPTPRAGNPGSRKPGTGGKILAEEAKIHAGPPAPEKSSTSGKNHGSWPTARSSDAEGGRIKTEQTEKGFRSKREKSDQYFGAKLRDAAEMEKPPSMKLNPNWVEQLMGLPVGWTQLPTEWTDYDSSETALSPKPQK